MKVPTSLAARSIAAILLLAAPTVLADSGTELSQLLALKMGNVTCTATNEGLTIQSGDNGDGRLMTVHSYSVPVRIDVSAKTDSSNVRLYFGPWGRAIFGWESKPDELRFHDPVDGTERHQPGKGRIAANKWLMFTWIIEENRSRLLVDGEERATTPGKYNGVSSPFGIGPGVGSTITVKSIRISEGARVLVDTSANPLPKRPAEPVIAAGPTQINARLIKLSEPKKVRLTNLLTSCARNGSVAADAAQPSLAARALAIALLLEPDDREAVVLAARLRRGDPIAPTTSAPTLPMTNTVVEEASAIAKELQASLGKDDRLLAAYLWSIVLGLEPNNDEALYQTEILKRAGITADWTFLTAANNRPASAPR